MELNQLSFLLTFCLKSLIGIYCPQIYKHLVATVDSALLHTTATSEELRDFSEKKIGIYKIKKQSQWEETKSESFVVI